jgi:hypothetical protein
MKRFMTKKIAAIGVVATLLAGGAVAFAYTQGGATGSGNGGTTAGTPSTLPVTLSVTVTPGITPGGTTAVSFDVSNPNSTPVLLTTISAAFQTTTNPMGSIGPVGSTGGVSGCEGVINSGTDVALPATQFWLTPVGSSSLSNVPVPENAGGVLVAAGAVHQPLPTGGTLHWYSTPTSTGINQNACNGAPLTLYVTTP